MATSNWVDWYNHRRLYAALLDTLGIGAVAVVGTSAGTASPHSDELDGAVVSIDSP